jgi:predicted metal-dependent peptidase
MQTKDDQAILLRLQDAKRLLILCLPYFAGLVQGIQVQLDDRVPAMGVFLSGRLLVNRGFVQGLLDNELVFVLAHELYHLALKTHARSHGTNGKLFNIAHDFIINDFLRVELNSYIPAGGLNWPGARKLCAENIVNSLAEFKNRGLPNFDEFGTPVPGSRRKRSRNLQDPLAPGDILTSEQERQWFPETSFEKQEIQTHAMDSLIEHALAIDLVLKSMAARNRGDQPGHNQVTMEALRGMHQQPWEVALQRWVEAVSPSTRTFGRPSRRSGDRTDLVLPGRKRDGWILHIVLDTSGSMAHDLPRVLGAVSAFCEGVGVEQVHLIQCDTQVTREEMLAPAELASYEVAGLGGSDLTPAMIRLAEDPEVEAAIVLTDGEIGYPSGPMPYHVLWVLPFAFGPANFQPSYGELMWMLNSSQAEYFARIQAK